MSSQLYRYEAKDIDGFLSQLVRYIANGGHYFYIRVRVPDGSDPHAIAEKLLDQVRHPKSHVGNARGDT